MKTTKRAFSLFLALVMVSSMFFVSIPSASAAFSTEYAATDGKTLANVSTFDDVVDFFGIATSSSLSTMTAIADGGTGVITIDFSAETIYWTNKPKDEEIPTFVSFDGGTKWSQMKFTIGDKADDAGDFSKFLNKESTIWLTTAIDKATKQPQKAVAEKKDTEGNVTQEKIDAAVVYKFSKINARPKLEKFTIDYLTYADKTDGTENGQWTLKAAGSQKLENLQVAYSSDKKTPVEAYGVFPTGEGLNIVEGAKKPGEKITFLVRVAATKNSAGSKPKKFGITTLGKAPNLKMDYKKNLIKMKANMILGTAASLASPTSADAPEPDMDDITYGLVTPAKPTTKESKEVKPGYTVTLTDEDVFYVVRTVATEKKPASLPQVITVKAMSEINETMVSPTVKGTTIRLPKGYEACKLSDSAKADTKWKGSVKGTGQYAVRVKNTAKYNAKTNATNGNPVSGILILDTAATKDSKGKDSLIATYIGTASSFTTDSNIDYAVYVPAKNLINVVKAVKDEEKEPWNKAPSDLNIPYETIGSGITYTIKGLSEITGVADVTDSTLSSNPLVIITKGNPVKKEGSVTLTFNKPSGSGVDKDATFYTPEISIEVTNFVASASSIS